MLGALECFRLMMFMMDNSVLKESEWIAVRCKVCRRGSRAANGETIYRDCHAIFHLVQAASLLLFSYLEVFKAVVFWRGQERSYVKHWLWRDSNPSSHT